jgi:hypothetical protein
VRTGEHLRGVGKIDASFGKRPVAFRWREADLQVIYCNAK